MYATELLAREILFVCFFFRFENRDSGTITNEDTLNLIVLRQTTD